MNASFSDLRPGLLTYGLDRPPTGVGRYAIELITSLTEMGFPPALIGNPAPFLPGYRGYRRVRLPGGRWLPGLLTLGNLSIHRAVRKAGVNLVHDPTGNPPFLFGADGVKTVVTVHDVFALAFPGSSTLIENLVTRFWLRLVLPRVDCVITDSQSSKLDITHYLGVPAEKLKVVYLSGARDLSPVSRAQAAPVIRQYGLEPGYLLMVGSLDKRRNLPRLLEAYGRLRRAGERRPLVIVGKHRQGADRRDELLAEFDVRGSVHFLGYVAFDDLAALYSAADLFVFPSLYEGFGITPLEAMACGAPVLASNVSSLPEVLGDAAILVDPYSVDALTDGMRRILINPALQADLRARGLKRAAEFTWERTARHTLEVYRQLL